MLLRKLRTAIAATNPQLAITTSEETSGAVAGHAIRRDAEGAEGAAGKAPTVVI